MNIDNKDDYNDDDKSYAIYKSIIRAIFVTNNNRVMTFHAYSNPAIDTTILRTNVKTFANEKLFKKAYDEIVKTEFPKLKNKFKNILKITC